MSVAPVTSDRSRHSVQTTESVAIKLCVTKLQEILHLFKFWLT